MLLHEQIQAVGETLVYKRSLWIDKLLFGRDSKDQTFLNVKLSWSHLGFWRLFFILLYSFWLRLRNNIFLLQKLLEKLAVFEFSDAT